MKVRLYIKRAIPTTILIAFKQKHSSMKIKFPLLILLILLFTNCIPDERKMMKTEVLLAKKYHAESFQLNFLTVKTKTYKRTKDHKKLLSVSIKNTTDIQKIFEDDTYSSERANSIANYIIDSLRFERLPFEPSELKIEFISEVGFSFLKNEAKKTYTYQFVK